ncbi:MAG: transcription factor S [Methanosarcinaceae archaeon]|nr:transcription factor S [Methanosarcinaceae archaeon]
MKFCPKCKSMMVPSNGSFKCRKCGEVISANIAESLTITSSAKDREITILEGKIDEGLPTIEVACPECKNKKAYWWLRQLRSADESETRFFKCTQCSYTWREYD